MSYAREPPQALRDFFKNLENPPWLDYEAFRPEIRAFHANVDLMLVLYGRRHGGKNVQDRLYVRADAGRRFDNRGEYVDRGHSVGYGLSKIRLNRKSGGFGPPPITSAHRKQAR